jgi:hypothetical protein
MVKTMTRCEVDEFEAMIESALDAGRAAARVHRTVDEALSEWSVIDAFREGFSQEAMTCDFSVRNEFLRPLPLHPRMQRQS